MKHPLMRCDSFYSPNVAVIVAITPQAGAQTFGYAKRAAWWTPSYWLARLTVGQWCSSRHAATLAATNFVQRYAQWDPTRSPSLSSDSPVSASLRRYCAGVVRTVKNRIAWRIARRMSAWSKWLTKHDNAMSSLSHEER